MKTRALLIGAIIALSAVLTWLIVSWEPITAKPIARIQGHDQLSPTQIPQGGAFRLQGPRGPIALSDYRGKVVLIYFGYTYCPDVCPTSLSLLAQALSALTPAERERVQGIFISLDPERDTLARLMEYAHFFHPGLIGVSGTTEQIATVAKQYGASFLKQKADANGQYAVDHSSVTYVVNQAGELAASLPHGSSPQKIIDAVRPLLAAGTSK